MVIKLKKKPILHIPRLKKELKATGTSKADAERTTKVSDYEAKKGKDDTSACNAKR